MATPLIRIPQEQGGTMYAFSSAARDLTRAYYNPDIVFEYSKFALLDIPVVAEPSANSTNNYIQFNNLFKGGIATGTGGNPAINDEYDGTDPDDNANRHFAQSFQNYALNLENFILSDDDFDDTLYSSDSEKIFFKWLNHLGAFRTKPASTQEASTGYSRTVEDDDSIQTGSEYSKVVRYLGNVDVTNDKNYNGDTYNEVFINVPSSVGYTPTVLFKSTDYNTNDTSYQTNTTINGRDGQSHPDSNINLRSIADSNDGTINIDPNNSYNYGIEWDPAAYSKIVADKKLSTLSDYSKRGGDFRFNAILVYYDVYSKSNPGNKSTNLYGVIILDNWKYDPASTGWSLPELSKYKPNEVTGLNGNAFALKLNVKFNSSLDNVGIEKNINDYSTFSMDIFFDSTSALENASKVLADASHRYTELSGRLNELESLFLTAIDREDLKVKILELEESLENASLNFENAGSILELIASTNARINKMISGEIPTEIQYNTDVIANGDGTLIDKSVKDKIKIHNINYGYALNEVHSYDYTTGQVLDKINKVTLFNPAESTNYGLWTRLKKYENLIRIYLETTEVFEDNLNIYLDDSVNTFKLGQTIKIVFRSPILNLNNKSINIYTDKNNGWILKGSINSSDLLTNKPYVELICVDEINKTFELDIIR
jgi:hypothetical protein